MVSMKDCRQAIRTRTAPGGRLSTLAFESFGARILLGSTDRRVLQDLVPLLPPDSRAVTPGKEDAAFFIQKKPKRRFYSVIGSTNGAREELAYRTLEELASEFHFAVSVFARPYLFVHAGVVAWRGRAIVLPGPTMSGKSTLVSALVDLGATYCSDEFAAIDRYGRIHPYRRGLMLRTRGTTQRRLEYTQVSARDHNNSLLPGVVAFLKYKSSSLWHPRTLTPAEAVLALFGNTVAARARGPFALRALSRLARRATSIKGFRPDASIGATKLIELASQCSHATRPLSMPDTNRHAEL